MAVTFENATIEYYLFLIVVKLGVMISFSCIKSALKLHSSYRKSLKKKFAARDIEAPKTQQRASYNKISVEKVKYSYISNKSNYSSVRIFVCSSTSHDE